MNVCFDIMYHSNHNYKIIPTRKICLWLANEISNVAGLVPFLCTCLLKKKKPYQMFEFGKIYIRLLTQAKRQKPADGLVCIFCITCIILSCMQFYVIQ